MIALLIFSVNTFTCTAVELFVNPGGSIQGALNNSTSGDTIIVAPGNYTEKLMVTTSDIVIRSDSLIPANTTIIATGPDTSGFYVRADNVTIEGFKVWAGKYKGVTGIHLAGCNRCTIENNDFSENWLGLYMSNSRNNTIANNKMNSNERYGIQLVHSEDNILVNNSADSNTHGIILENNCIYNNLTNNSASSNLGNGLYFINSSSNSIKNNSINKNDMGIYLANSNISVMTGNDFSRNMRYGMWISHSNYNIVAGNTINKNLWGIHQNSSDFNVFYGNILISNIVTGLSMCPACDNNTVFNNYFNNNLNADIKNTKNTWNTKKTSYINVVGGPYLGGNFWAAPDGKGFSETAPDENKDGFADEKYNESNVTDSLPLVSNLSAGDLKQQIFPDANFSSINKISIPKDDKTVDSGKISENLTEKEAENSSGNNSKNYSNKETNIEKEEKSIEKK